MVQEEVDAILEVYEANRETAMLLGIPSPEPMSADDLAVKIRENSFYSPQVIQFYTKNQDRSRGRGQPSPEILKVEKGNLAVS